MKKIVSGLLCAAMTASMVTVMSGGASAAGTEVDQSWQYKTMVDFEELADGFQFGGADDVGLTLYLDQSTDYGAKAISGGYKGSNMFSMYSKGSKSGYAQPLINVGNFSDKNTEFEGATEFWMWVDFTKVAFDEVSLQFRIIEADYNTDGTEAVGSMSQLALEEGKPVYIQDSKTTWKELAVTTDYKIPVEKMVGYKGFVRLPIDSMVFNESGTDVDGKANLKNVFQLWFIYNFPNNNPEEYIGIDQVMFVGPSMTDGKAITKISLEDTNAGGTGVADATTNVVTTATTITTTATTKAATTAATTKAATTTAPQETDGNGLMVGIIIAVCIVVIGGGAAVYFLVIKKKGNSTGGDMGNGND